MAIAGRISQKYVVFIYLLFILFCRQLCLFLNAEHIYRSLSEILLETHELKFSTEMVQLLNEILLTSSELFELRNQLKDLATEVIKMSERFFK